MTPLPVGIDHVADEIDRESFGSIYQQYYSRLVRYCARLADPQAAEEIAQETMTRALASLDRFDPSRPMWPWLKTIAVNLVRDIGRRAGREISAAEPTVSSLDHAQTVEDRALLEMALARLSSRQRTALGLRYLNGWEPVQVGSHFGLSASATRQLLSRARIRLRIEFRRLADTAFGFLVAPWAALRRSMRSVARLQDHLEPAVSGAASSHAAHGFVSGAIGLALVLGAGGAGLSEGSATPPASDAPRAHAGPRVVDPQHEPSRPPPGRAGGRGAAPLPASSSVDHPEPAPDDPGSNAAGPDVSSPPPSSPAPADDAALAPDDPAGPGPEVPSPAPPSPPPAEEPSDEPHTEQTLLGPPEQVQLRPFP